VITDSAPSKAVSTQLPAMPEHSRTATGTIIVIATVIIGLTVAAIGVYKIRGWKRPTVGFENIKLSKLTTDGKVVTAAISPDGRDFAYATADAGKQTLWMRQVATSSSSVEIVGASEGDYHGISFSPDGHFIYYLRSFVNEPNTVFKVSAIGGSPIKLHTGVDSPVAISTDGKYMTYLRGYPDQMETALIVSSADGGVERKVVVLKSPSGFVINSGPSWSPDGKRIAAVGKNEDGPTSFQQLLICDVANGSVTRLEKSRWQHLDRVTWVGDGNSIVVTGTDQESAGAQVWQITLPTGDAKRISNDLVDYSHLTMTRNSKQLLAVENDRQGNIWIAPSTDETRATQLTSANGDGFDGLSFTPSGGIIYSALSNGQQNLWLIDSDGRNARQLTNTAGINRTPVVSPDGKYVVFGSNRSGATHLWRIAIDGSQPLELTHGVSDTHPQITPDGKWIVYRAYNNGNPNLFRVSIDGGEPTKLTDRIVGPPAISPDGKFVACSYREVALQATKLAIIPINGGQAIKQFDMTPPTLDYRWTGDGKALTYVRTIAGVSNIWRQSVEGGPPQQLTHFSSELIFATDWSRDGKFLIYSRGNRSRDAILLAVQ
jgi:Tol biopolymer transport system component